MNNNTQIILSGITVQDLEAYVKAIVKKAIKESINTTIMYQTVTRSQNELLNRKQLSEFLGISLPTLHARVKDGSIPFCRIGKKILFDKNKVMGVLGKIGG